MDTEEEKVEISLSTKIITLKEDPIALKDVAEILEQIKVCILDCEAEESLAVVKWLFEKVSMRNDPEIKKDFALFSKGIYYAKLGKNIGSEIEKDRPCILISSTSKSEVAVVVPISDEDKYIGSTFWFHVPINDVGTALVEQIRTISKGRIRRPLKIGNKIKEISESERISINQAIDKLKLQPKRA
ncbi:type II toxin-antitoxin system PemK/MazF family toxin [Paenibacillus odorifer]|uniref:type II toxin-antitoxin system PemK/MazF family toxin n=1 Tax=Paenibacillus odorifer TaxID=189426 RepID=UPI0013A6C0CF|nr:type II toxin-antitoxin system PemK/MazF family toxin [Paenibacillus odorifer]